MIESKLSALYAKLERALTGGESPDPADVLQYTAELSRSVSAAKDPQIASLLPRLVHYLPIDKLNDAAREGVVAVLQQVDGGIEERVANEQKLKKGVADAINFVSPPRWQDVGDSWVIPKVRFPAGYDQATNALVYLVRDVRVFKDRSAPLSSNAILTENQRLGPNAPVVPSMPLQYAIEARVVTEREAQPIARAIFDRFCTDYGQSGVISSSRVRYVPRAVPDIVLHSIGRPEGSALGGAWSLPCAVVGPSGRYLTQLRDADIVMPALVGESDVAAQNVVSQALARRATKLWRVENKSSTEEERAVFRGFYGGGFYIYADDDLDLGDGPALRVMAHEVR